MYLANKSYSGSVPAEACAPFLQRIHKSSTNYNPDRDAEPFVAANKYMT